MKKVLFLALCGSLLWAQNPVVRLSYVVPFNAASATSTQTSSAIRIPNLSGYGTLTITGSGITGSPSGCQVALEYQQSTGTTASSAFATQSFTPGNSYQSFTITPSAGFASGDTLIAVYTCSVYPSAGTITATFDPSVPVNIQGSVPVTGTFWQATQPVSGTVTVQQSTASSLKVDLSGTAANSTAIKVDASGTTVPVSGTFWQATQPVSGTVTANAGTGTFTVSADPCFANTKTFSLVNLTANTQIITGTASKKTYVCAINLVAGAATNVALVEGTGTICATGTAGMAGGSTAATGWNFAANGGLTLGNGTGSVMATATTANNVCLLVSAANQISGTIAYVQQ